MFVKKPVKIIPQHDPARNLLRAEDGFNCFNIQDGSLGFIIQVSTVILPGLIGIFIQPDRNLFLQ
jgi:hypothetical protein